MWLSIMVGCNIPHFNAVTHPVYLELIFPAQLGGYSISVVFDGSFPPNINHRLCTHTLVQPQCCSSSEHSGKSSLVFKTICQHWHAHCPSPQELKEGKPPVSLQVKCITALPFKAIISLRHSIKASTFQGHLDGIEVPGGVQISFSVTKDTVQII